MTTETSTPFDPSTSDLPIFATQGGGFAIFVLTDGGKYVWHGEIPDYMVAEGAKIGDPIPEEWGLAAANTSASREMDREFDSPFAGEPYFD